MATTSAREMLQESHIVNHIFITVPHAFSVFISNWGKKTNPKQAKAKTNHKTTVVHFDKPVFQNPFGLHLNSQVCVTLYKHKKTKKKKPHKFHIACFKLSNNIAFFFFKCTVAGLKETALPFHVRIQNTNLHLG